MVVLIFPIVTMFIIISIVRILKSFSQGQINYINALQKLKSDRIINDREYNALVGAYNDMNAREFVINKYEEMTGRKIDFSTSIKSSNRGEDIINYEYNPVAENCEIDRFVEMNNLNPIKEKGQKGKNTNGEDWISKY